MVRKSSIRQALIDLAAETYPEILRIEPTLIRWGKRADINIGSYYEYVRTIKTLDVVDCKAELPLDAVHVNVIFLGEYDCDDCTNLILRAEQMYINETTLSLSNSESLTFYWANGNLSVIPINWEIQGDYIVFDNNYNNQKITIQYLAYETDDNGLPLVNNTHLPAIVEFMKLKVAERDMFKSFKSAKMTRRGDMAYIEGIKKEYHRLVRKARGEDNEWTASQKEVVAAILNDPLTGHGSYLLKNLH